MAGNAKHVSIRLIKQSTVDYILKTIISNVKYYIALFHQLLVSEETNSLSDFLF